MIGRTLIIAVLRIEEPSSQQIWRRMVRERTLLPFGELSGYHGESELVSLLGSR